MAKSGEQDDQSLHVPSIYRIDTAMVESRIFKMCIAIMGERA